MSNVGMIPIEIRRQIVAAYEEGRVLSYEAAEIGVGRASVVFDFVALFDSDALGLALGDELLEEWVGDLDVLFGQVDIRQVSPTSLLLPLRVGIVRAVGILVIVGQFAGELVELGAQLLELELQLRRVDALRFRHEQPPLDERELLLEASYACRRRL